MFARAALCIMPFLLATGIPARVLAGQTADGPLRFFPSTTMTYGGLRTAGPSAKNLRPKIGIALAGGGAKAAASIGVLKVLRQEGIMPAAIAGTSMGSIVGGLAAAGYTPGEIESIFVENDLNALFTDTPSRAFLTQEQKEAGDRHLLQFSIIGGRFMAPSGLTAGQKLDRLLRSKTLAASFQAGQDFDNLPVPFRAVATDIENGAPVAVREGLLSDAMRASSAIPVVFQPVAIRGRLLIDGGLSNNLPVDVVRSMGTDLVIAVDPSSRLERKERLSSLVEIMSQSVSIPVRRETEQQAARADIVIAPDTAAYSFADFSRIADIIRTGEEAAYAALPRIRDAVRRRSERQAVSTYRITELSVQGTGAARESSVRGAFAKALARRDSTADEIGEALTEVHRLGVFSEVSLELVRRGAEYGAVITVAENPVVNDIRVSGDGLVPPAEVLRELKGQAGATLNVTAVSGALERVVRRYREQGYLLVSVRRAGMEPGGGTLAVEFTEGRVDAIRLEGQRRTRQSLIDREIDTAEGKPLNFGTLDADVQRLFALNYFESINVDVADSGRGGVLLTFRIREKPRGTLRLGLRYDLEDSFTGLADLVVDNLGGRGIKLFLHTRFGNYADVALGYRSPVILNTYFVHSLQGFYRDRTYSLYTDGKKTGELEVSRTGVDFAFGYQWFRFGDTYLRYRYSSDRSVNVYGAPEVRNPTQIGSLAFLTTIDTRDRSMFPRRGILFKGSYETASSSYGGDLDFRKTTLYGQGTLPLGERHTVIADLSAGFGSGDLPYQELFGIGGADHLLGFPLPGYHRREFVGANELGADLAYRWMLAEYHLNVIRAVYLSLCGGAANVWDARDDMSLHDLRWGASIGLHADTLIGPVRFDIAAGEDRRYLVYFSAGLDF